MGGVSRPNWSITVINIPYHTRSKPRPEITGAIMGNVSSIKASSSMKAPRGMYIRSEMTKITQGETGSVSSQLVKAVAKPEVARKTLKARAPTITNITEQVILTDLVSAVTRTERFSWRLTAIRTKDPKAPIAAASEGAKMPKNIPPITRPKSTTIPQTPPNEIIRSFQEKDSLLGGPKLGLIWHRARISSTNTKHNNRPG